MAITAPNYVQGKYTVAQRDALFDRIGEYPDASGGITNQVPTLTADGTIIWRQQSSGGGDGTANANIAVVEDTSTASQAYAIGALLVYSGQLYRVTAAIAQGGTITPGTNVTPTTVADELESGGGGGVSSFNGRTGAVTPQSGDYSASDVGALPAPSNTGTAGQVLKKTADGSEWANESGGGGNDANLAPVETTSTASQAYAINTFLVYGGQLYRVTAAIAQGDTLTVGTNIAAEDVGTYLAMVAAAPNASGFAPSGYGLGNNLYQIVAASAAETTAAYGAKIDAFISTFSGDGYRTAFAYGFCPDLYGTGQYLIQVTWYKSGSTISFASALFFPINTGTSYEGRMIKTTGGWQPFEWVNPPLVADTEYRTTERWNGKPVYQKLVDLGAVTANTENVFSHGIANFGICVGITAWFGALSTGLILPFLRTTASLAGQYNVFVTHVTNTSVGVFAGSARTGGDHVHAVIKYTKSTD